MDHLFEVPTAKKLLLLTKEDLIHYIQQYSSTNNIQRRQIQDLQRENDRLRHELGYGQTALIPFPDVGS